MKVLSLAVVCSDMTVMKEFIGRTSNFFVGSNVISYDDIPFLIVKGKKERIETLKTFLFLISILEKEFIGKILWFERDDL